MERIEAFVRVFMEQEVYEDNLMMNKLQKSESE